MIAFLRFSNEKRAFCRYHLLGGAQKALLCVGGDNKSQQLTKRLFYAGSNNPQQVINQKALLYGSNNPQQVINHQTNIFAIHITNQHQPF